jgi:hypothetical protein
MGDQWFVGSPSTLSEPAEVARVDRIPKHAMNLGRRQSTVTPMMAETGLEGLRRKGLQ